jgi:hypothetical protein
MWKVRVSGSGCVLWMNLLRLAPSGSRGRYLDMASVVLVLRLLQKGRKNTLEGNTTYLYLTSS